MYCTITTSLNIFKFSLQKVREVKAPQKSEGRM